MKFSDSFMNASILRVIPLIMNNINMYIFSHVYVK